MFGGYGVMHFSTTFGAVRHFFSLFKLLQINRGLTDISLRVAFRVFHPFPWKTYNIFLQTRSKTIPAEAFKFLAVCTRSFILFCQTSFAATPFIETDSLSIFSSWIKFFLE